MWKGILILSVVAYLTVKTCQWFLMPWLEQFDPHIVIASGYVFVSFVTVASRCIVSVVWPDGYGNDKCWEVVVGRVKLYFGGIACLFSIPVLVYVGYCQDWAMTGELCIFTNLGVLLLGFFTTIGHACMFVSWFLDDSEAKGFWLQSWPKNT